MCTVYANKTPGALVGPHSVRLWIEQPSVVRPDSPLPAGLDKIQSQPHGHVYWMEMPESTRRNWFVWRDRAHARGYRYCLLIGTTRLGTPMLLADPEVQLPVAEMISIRNSRHVRMWWLIHSPNELMDLLCFGHRTCA